MPQLIFLENMKSLLTSSIFLSLALFFIGCNGGENTPGAGVIEKEVELFVAPETPEATVDAFSKAIQSNQPDAIYNLLPKSYQTELNGLVKQFAEGMDATLWNDANDLIKQATGIMKDKKDLIMQLEEVQDQRAELNQNWGDLVKTLDSVTNSDFMDLEKLKKGDINGLLKNSGRGMMNSIMDSAKKMDKDGQIDTFMNMVKGVQTEVLSSADGTAKLKLSSADGKETEELDMVQVDGVWIPAEIAKNFDGMIAQAKDGLTSIHKDSENFQSIKGMAGLGMMMAKGTLAKIDAAKTPKELKDAAGSIFDSLGGMLGQ